MRSAALRMADLEWRMIRLAGARRPREADAANDLNALLPDAAPGAPASCIPQSAICDRPFRRRSVTLVELTIAMIVTAFIGLAVALILQSAAYGTSSRRDIRRLAARAEMLRDRLNDAVRGARSILASGSDHLVLWVGDSRQNEQVNLSELQLIELSGGTITSYTTVWPAGWSQSAIDNADTAYPAGSDFAGIAQAAKSSGLFPGTVWSTGVSNLSIALNGPTPQLSTMTTWSLTLTSGGMSEPLTGAASLRQSAAPQ